MDEYTKSINAYSFSFHSLKDNQTIPLSLFKDKVILIVNTASRCGFTKQYAGLEIIYQKYKEQGLVVLGVPSNDFGRQEPGTSNEIASFCAVNFGVSFPLTAKEVVSGNGAHPFFKWASDQAGFWSKPRWNFHKYLISRDGTLLDYFFPFTEPTTSRMIKSLEKALRKH